MKSTSKIHSLIIMVIALVGLVFYFVTSFTGYLANASVNAAPIVLTIAAELALAVFAFKGGSLAPVLRDGLLLLAGCFLIISFAAFVLGRVTLAADVYFIPVNYPAAEETALNLSFVGLAGYLLSVIGTIALAFRKI